MYNSSKIDTMDILLYSAMPYVILREVDEYNTADSSIELTQKNKNKIYRRINRERVYREKHQEYHPRIEIIKRVIAVVLIIVSASFAGLMSVEAVRTALWNAIVEWYENSIFVKYETPGDVAAPDKILEYMEPVFGNAYTRYEMRKNEHSFAVEYENSDATIIISYHQDLLYNFQIWLSNNDTEMHPIQVKQYDGYSTTNNSEGIEINGILWHDDKYAYRLAGNATVNNLLELASNLIVVDSVE